MGIFQFYKSQNRLQRGYLYVWLGRGESVGENGGSCASFALYLCPFQFPKLFMSHWWGWAKCVVGKGVVVCCCNPRTLESPQR